MVSKRPPRPRDPLPLAKPFRDIATGQVADVLETVDQDELAKISERLKERPHRRAQGEAGRRQSPGKRGS
jgi:hypothetical protein